VTGWELPDLHLNFFCQKMLYLYHSIIVLCYITTSLAVLPFHSDSNDSLHGRTERRKLSTASFEDQLIQTRATALKWRKKAAEAICGLDALKRHSGHYVDETGTWCLAYANPRHREGYHPDKWPEAYEPMYGKQPAHHVLPDFGLAATIFKNLFAHRNNKSFSLLDIGAGIGQYGIWMNHNTSGNVRWQGYDGAGNVESFTNGLVTWIDVTDPTFDTIEPPGYKSDFILSLEVGEHIPPSTTKTFIQLLDRHNIHGILLSWGVKGQGGHGHINNLDNSEVVSLFESFGYHQDSWARAFQEEARRTADYWWFRNTFMVFVRK
jgi:hypothetical protein